MPSAQPDLTRKDAYTHDAGLLAFLAEIDLRLV